MQNPIRILSTKKLLSNQKKFLLNAGFSVIECDFIEIKNKEFELDQINDNLIFTSGNAFASFLENEGSRDFIKKSIFCVGLKTRELIANNGFKVVESEDNASQLSEKIKQYKGESFTFFSGNMRLETLPASLKIAEIRFNEIEVYETVLSSIEIKTTVDGILFFSPSAVKSYLQQNKIISEICFCIGTTTAEALQNITPNIIIAKQPSVENTIIQCINFYK